MTRPLSEVLQVLESEQDIELPMDPAYYQRLHDRIMAGVAQSENAPPDWYEKPRSARVPPSWRNIVDASTSLNEPN